MRCTRARRSAAPGGAFRSDRDGLSSGDDVWRDLVFDESDAIAQLQLAFLEALKPQQIGGRRLMQGFDRRVEIAMFLLQPGEFDGKNALIVVGHDVDRQSVRPRNSRPCWCIGKVGFILALRRTFFASAVNETGLHPDRFNIGLKISHRCRYAMTLVPCHLVLLFVSESACRVMIRIDRCLVSCTILGPHRLRSNP